MKGENLPIDMDLLNKRAEIPALIADLSYLDKKQAIKYIRLWGERRITINEIHQQLINILKENKHRD